VKYSISPQSRHITNKQLQAGLTLFYQKIDKALSELKNVKASGIDGIPAEILIALGQDLFDICSDIYRNGHWPKDFTESIIIAI